MRKIVVEYLGDVLLGPALVVSLPRPGGDFLRQEAFLFRDGPFLLLKFIKSGMWFSEGRESPHFLMSALFSSLDVLVVIMSKREKK